MSAALLDGLALTASTVHVPPFCQPHTLRALWEIASHMRRETSRRMAVLQATPGGSLNPYRPEATVFVVLHLLQQPRRISKRVTA